jgi:hypothetical protein
MSLSRNEATILDADGLNDDFTRRCLHCGIQAGTRKGAP